MAFPRDLTPTPQAFPSLPLPGLPPIPGGFYPFFASAEAGAASQASWGGERVAAGSHRSMQTTFPVLRAFAAGAAWLLADIGSLFVFIAWGCVI